ncbi:protein SCO1/2 [Sinorhizobium kostiense]|uniref:Protein SCO1/2 n=1 Tax=Sinorhizobium kostiense TaxID=76747 RepID=A0ABS4R085_9HYPH|nr:MULTISPECIES: SCO family protein [Sinorhizobium]MBP2236293.1 protein SCO1/2 [Sinorhizobium kostiense]PST20709.1 hypothetical protein C7U60_14865 [Mesorhizobium plurifarium]
MVALELQALAREIDRAAAGRSPGEDLTRYFRDSDPIYAGLGSADVDRVRAYAFAALARTAPEFGLAAAREEIGTGNAPGPVAAAARLVAALDAPDRVWLDVLAAAAQRLRGRDQKVWFDRIAAGTRPDISETAMTELARAFLMVARKNGLGAADCAERIAAAPEGFARAVREGLAAGESEGPTMKKACCCDDEAATAPPSLSATEAASGRLAQALRNGAIIGAASSCCDAAELGHAPAKILPAEIWAAPIEDQDGGEATLGARLLGRPSVLAFFYTRCMNPLKCSRTVSVLAATAQLAAAEGLAVGIFGMTYDPSWDTPARLRRYGVDRGMAFTPDVALLRATCDWNGLRAALDLAVGYGPSTVNRHRIEVLVLDAAGRAVFKCDGRPPEAAGLLALLKGAHCRRFKGSAD